MPPTVPARSFVSYLRVSTRRQGQSGLGLEAQRVTVEAFVRQAGGRIVREFVEIESGRRRDRPELREALVSCRIMRATLVVAKLDRLARNAFFLLSLRESGADLVACDLPSMNRVTVGIMAIIAEEEARAISERTRAALAAAKARGTRLGTPENLSCDGRRKGARTSAESRRATSETLARDMRGTLREIEEFGALSLRAVARELDRRSVPAPRGGRWSASSVDRLRKRISELDG